MLINHLGILPINYNENINIIYDKLAQLKIIYPNHFNLINYVEENYIKYFKDNSYYYMKYIDKVRSNSFLENYNGYLKKELGNKKEINYIILKL